MQAMVQGAWGVIPAHLSELSPDSVRGFLPGFGYQVGVLFSSVIPRLEADIAHRTSYSVAMAGTAVTVFLLAAIATALGPERKAVTFGEH
jgi:MFS transporter, SHS family, lactate transporter